MRVQVTWNDELVSKIDEFAKYVGTNRSSICALAIGQYVRTTLEATTDHLKQCEKE